MIRVLKDNVAMLQLDTLQSMSTTLFIPETIEEGTRKCRVMAVGPGYYDEHGKFHGVDVEVGDLVYCARYCGRDIKMEEDGEDVKYLLARCDDIIAVFPREVNNEI